MKSVWHSLHVVCNLVCFSLVMVISSLSSADATNGCYRYITFKNEAAYIATAGVSYRFNNDYASQPTGNFPVGQEKRVGVPCAATDVRVWAKAVAGHDIFSQGLGAAQDRCFRLKGTTFNPRYESCDPAGTAPVEPPGCYKHITFKNQGAYVANANVTYFLDRQQSVRYTGNFPAGQEKRVAVPCSANSIHVKADAVAGNNIIWDDYFQTAQDRCFAFKGTTTHTSYESCDPPGTPPVFTIDCWKHVTIKNEGAYIANAHVTYTIRTSQAESTKRVNSGNFSHGETKRIPVPCGVSSLFGAEVVGGAYIVTGLPRLEANRDYCYVFKGTAVIPNYSPCPVTSPPIPSYPITIRNYGAYATELSATYSYQGQRPTKREVIQTRQQGAINIPQQATNIYLKAKAIGGETIFEKNFGTAQALCYEVRGTTLITRYESCSN